MTLFSRILKKPSLFLFFFFIFLECNAQQLQQHWIQSFQGQGKASDRIAAIHTDPSGNVYVAGHAGNQRGAPDAFAMKRNAQGDTLWTYYYDGGGKNNDYATAISVDNAGNTYITGRSQNASYLYECFSAKILPSGTQAWVQRYSPGSNTQSYGNAITVDTAGNVYVAGYTDPTSGSNDWLVIKYNATGTQEWVDILNGPGGGDDEAMDVVIAPNGNPTVCGYTYSVNTSGGVNAFVKQYTPANGTVWTDTWTNPAFTGTDKAFNLGYSSGGDLFVGGETRNSTGSNRDAFAMRYDSTGNRLWATIYADATTTMDEYLRKVVIDNSGNLYFTGTDYQNGYVTCIRNDGTMGWRRKWNGPLSNGSDVFHGITVDNAGGVYVTGRGVYSGPDYYANGGLPNMIISKYNSNGDSLWTYRCLDSTNSSMGFTITYNDGKIFAGGFTTDTAYINENLYTIILDTSGSAISEWIYNGIGESRTMGQFVRTDSSNNVYCAATIDRLYGEGTDVVVIKYDPAGNLLSESYYSSPGFHNDTITAMQFHPSGDLVLCIASDINKLQSNYRLSLLRMDTNGNFTDTSWYSFPGNVLAKSMDISPNGSIAIAASQNTNTGMIFFFDSLFTPAWAAKIDSAASVTRANSVTFFANNDIIVGGRSSSGGITGIIQRFDQAGTKLWTAIIDSVNVIDEIKDVTVNAQEEIAYTGLSGNQSILGKIDGTNGSSIWHKVYNAPTTSEYGVKVRFTPAGNIAFICRGWTGYVARYYTVQYSGAGVFQWSMVYSQTASDREPLAILVEPSNRVVTAGWAINGSTTNYDYVLAGYSLTGTVEFINTYTSSASTSWDQLRDLARDFNGDFIVTGQQASEFFNNYLFRMVTIKYGGTWVGEADINPSKEHNAFVYPNPSSDGRFVIADSSPEQIIYGRVFDMTGRFVATVNTESFTIDMNNAKPGIYVLVITREDLTTERIILVLN